MVTPDYRSTAIWLQLTSGDNQDMSAVIAALDDYLESRSLPEGVDPCGENGEFHTFVCNGPGFRPP